MPKRELDEALYANSVRHWLPAVLLWEALLQERNKKCGYTQA